MVGGGLLSNAFYASNNYCRDNCAQKGKGFARDPASKSHVVGARRMVTATIFGKLRGKCRQKKRDARRYTERKLWMREDLGQASVSRDVLPPTPPGRTEANGNGLLRVHE